MRIKSNSLFLKNIFIFAKINLKEILYSFSNKKNIKYKYCIFKSKRKKEIYTKEFKKEKDVLSQ
jgi:hypothetical protein